MAPHHGRLAWSGCAARSSRISWWCRGSAADGSRCSYVRGKRHRVACRLARPALLMGRLLHRRCPRLACARSGVGCAATGCSAERAVEQGDEADEALGGAVVRTARNARRAGAASCPRGEHGRGHRFAAYRQCSVDTGTPEKDVEDETGAAGGRNARRASGAMHGPPCRALAGAARWRKQGSHRATWHGGNVSGAVRPLHALGVERHLRAPAGPRERGTYCSGTCSVRTDPRREWGATEQGVQADEARVVLERGLVVGAYRGSAVIVRGPRGALASQLNAGVRLTR